MPDKPTTPEERKVWSFHQRLVADVDRLTDERDYYANLRGYLLSRAESAEAERNRAQDCEAKAVEALAARDATIEKLQAVLQSSNANVRRVMVERDERDAMIAALRKTLEILAGCLPDRIYIHPDGDIWSGQEPDEDAKRFEEYKEIDFKALLADPNP